MFEEILKGVEMIYDFEPKDRIEEKALQDLIGGPELYNAVMRFKKEGRTVEEAAQFFLIYKTRFNVSDMLGG